MDCIYYNFNYRHSNYSYKYKKREPAGIILSSIFSIMVFIFGVIFSNPIIEYLNKDVSVNSNNNYVSNDNITLNIDGNDGNILIGDISVDFKGEIEFMYNASGEITNIKLNNLTNLLNSIETNPPKTNPPETNPPKTNPSKTNSSIFSNNSVIIGGTINSSSISVVTSSGNTIVTINGEVVYEGAGTSVSTSNRKVVVDGIIVYEW